MNDRLVVRIKTSCWADNRGLHQRRDVLYMRRLSSGHNPMEEGADCAGAELEVAAIDNFETLPDGLYAAVLYATSTDWETGITDDYAYRMDPINEEQE